MKVKIQVAYIKNGKSKTKKYSYKLFASHWNDEEREQMLRDELTKVSLKLDVYFISMYWKDEDKTSFIDRRHLYT